MSVSNSTSDQQKPQRYRSIACDSGSNYKRSAFIPSYLQVSNELKSLKHEELSGPIAVPVFVQLLQPATACPRLSHRHRATRDRSNPSSSSSYARSSAVRRRDAPSVRVARTSTRHHMDRHFVSLIGCDAPSRALRPGLPPGPSRYPECRLVSKKQHCATHLCLHNKRSPGAV